MEPIMERLFDMYNNTCASYSLAAMAEAEMIMHPSPIFLLGFGILLTFLSQMRFGSSLLSWVSNVPFLLYMLRNQEAEDGLSSIQMLLVLFVKLCMAHSLAVLKICTKPMPLAAALAFGVPIAFFQFLGFALWHHASSENDMKTPCIFAACMVVQEFIQHNYTPYACWGAAANCQLDNLPLLQLTSLFGLAGPGFLVHWFNGLVAMWWHLQLQKNRDEGQTNVDMNSLSWSCVLWATLLALTNVWGSWRLGQATPTETVTVASVVTDATFGGIPLPTDDEIQAINDSLWKRTEKAAQAGAKLVSLTEGATMANSGDDSACSESKLQSKARQVAKQLGIELIISYIVPVRLEPSLLYENKAVWIRPDGSIDHTYLKNEPVPGEPAIRGDGSVVNIVETSFGRAALAICYDYDFPRLARTRARHNIQLVVVPSSDWRGIDPMHTKMAAIRGIEGGHSILRTTRMGLSAGTDYHGRIRGQLSANESNERILIVTLPLRGQKAPKTMHAGMFGNVLVVLSAAFAFSLWAQNVVGTR